jgi:endonuclease YncB( thermonuclease family)
MDRKRLKRFAIAALITIIAGAFFGHQFAQPRAQTVGIPAVAKPNHDTVTGQATVVDGDTLEITGVRIRIHGIDAPESDQWCVDAGSKRDPCGRRVSFELADMIGRQQVVCTPTRSRSYERIIARCLVNGHTDVGRWMVEGGRALAYRRYSRDYASAEDKARQDRRGLWAGEFQSPEEHRAAKRR